MSENARIYHNPRCSKSRETLALLREAGVEPEIVEYLKTPPSVAELQTICHQLGVDPRDLVRWKEKRVAELELTRDSDLSEDDWLRTLHENPVLIERPIVIAGSKAAIGRPPAKTLEIL